MSDTPTTLGPRAAVGAVLAVVALGVVAGAVGTGIVPEPEPPPDTGPEDRMDLEGSGGMGALLPGCPAPLRSGPVLALALFAVVATTAALAARRGPLVPVTLGVPLVVILAASCVSVPRLPLPGASLPTVPSWVPAVVVLAFFGLPALAVLVSALVYGVREAELSGDDEPEDDALAAVGETAGAAADRIEDASPVENEVYRAWEAMVRQLDVEAPQTATPETFAEAAVEAGMDGDDVARLTGLFEDVRYGGRDPASRADEAVSTLRRIEDAYAGGDAE